MSEHEQTNPKNRHLLVFGMGYAGTAIVERAKNSFATISATNRETVVGSSDDVQHLMFDGVSVDNRVAAAIETATHILVSIGPDANGDPVLEAGEMLIASAPNLQWIGYLSTVGVYGDHGGDWVNEETICKPVSKRSIERLLAEERWQALAEKRDIPLAIFRLSGIYGPGRNALVNIEKGRSRRLVKKDQVFNRIHRDDIAQAVDKAMAMEVGGLFNITDDEPAPPQDVVTFVHGLKGSEPPAEIDFDTADITPMARSFYGENKRVSNAKSKSVLGLHYLWPDYRTAFNAMWKNDNWK